MRLVAHDTNTSGKGGGGTSGAGGSGAAGDASGGAGLGVAGANSGGGFGVAGANGGGGIGVAGANGGGGFGVAGARGDAGASGSGTGGGPAGATGAGGAAGDAGMFHPLDMNDATILAPLPASTTTPVLVRGIDLADDGTSFVPRALFDRLVGDADIGGQPILPSGSYERLHLIAVRFDLCDRHLPGPCPEAEDARLRLVFQPIADGPGAHDVGFHAFYAIRNDEIPGAVAALRDLAGAPRRRAEPSASAPRLAPSIPVPTRRSCARS